MRLWLVLMIAWSSAAGAQEASAAAADSELAGIQADYEFGKFRSVLLRVDQRIDHGSLSEAELISLHKYAGLAAFNLGLKDQAQRHFEALLRLDPDFALDPFSVPPPIIAFLDKIRLQLDPVLARLREEHRFRMEREQHERELRIERDRLLELQRRDLEDAARRTAATSGNKAWPVNLLPFGAGQFQEGRIGWGVGLAVSEGLLAIASVVSYFLYDSLISSQTVIYDDSAGAAGRVTTRGILPRDQSKANVYTSLKYASGGAFYLLYAGGVVDAFLHFSPKLDKKPNAPQADLMIVPGGAAVGLTAHF